MKKIATLLLTLVILIAFAGCTCKHEWSEATCTEPKTCNLCGITEGTAVGHNYVNGYCTRCGLEDPDYFNPEEYGFINNYGMTEWIEVTKYSIANKDAYATFAESGHVHEIYKFKDNVFYDYSCFEKRKTSDEYKLQKTSNYSIVNNDSINKNGSAITIFDRIYDYNGNLIIKAMFGGAEKWFILKEQIDWDKSPEIEDLNHNGWKSYKYYFKKGT